MKNSLAPKLPRSIKTGDIICLGEHILICGDSSKVDLSVHGNIDLILTDPPYAVDYAESKRGIGKIAKDKDISNDGFMSDQQYVEFTKSWLQPPLAKLSKKNSIYIFNSDKMLFALREITACKRRAGTATINPMIAYRIVFLAAVTRTR